MSSTPPSYPAIRFIATQGNRLALAVAIVPVLLGLWALTTGWSWPWLGLGLGAGAVLWLILRSYAEVLRILADTLMPR